MDGLKTHTVMKLSHYHDFYYVQAIQAAIQNKVNANPEYGFRHSIDRLNRDIESYAEDLFSNLALRTFLYLYAVSYGEARHAKFTEAEALYITNSPNQRHDCYAQITKFPPNAQNIGALVKVFDQTWHESFGGDAWKNIAKSLQYYYEAPPGAFIDHVIDLEHNGGCVFSKDTRELCFDVEEAHLLKKFLDYKFRHDILKKHPQYYPYIYVTRKTYSLLVRYVNLFDETMPSWVRVGLESLTDYEVTWGNEMFTLDTKWTPWVSVSDGNEPTARILASLTKVHRLNLHRVNKEQVVAYAQKQTKKVLKQHKAFIKPNVKQAFEAKMSQWVDWASSHVKLSNLYSVIPCKFRKVGYNDIQIQIPLPYQGIGKQTPYGFLVEGKTTSMIQNSSDIGYDGTPGFTDGHITSSYGTPQLHTSTGTWNLFNTKLEATLYD